MKFSRIFARLPGVMSHAWGLALVFSVCLGAWALWLLDPIAMQSLRLAQFDQFQRWHMRPYAPVAVRVVDIDEASLKAYGQWPWPRSRVAALVDHLHASGATAIAFDVLLVEPDATAPAAMAKLWQAPQLGSLLANLPDPDQTLANSMTGRPVVLGANLLRTHSAASGASAPAPVPTPPVPYRVVSSGATPAAHWLAGFDSVVWPLPVLMVSASGVGALNMAPDSDGVLRRVPLLLRQGDQLIPSLSAEALRVAQGARNYVVRTQAGGVQDVRMGSITVPTNAKGEMWLHFTPDRADRLLPAKSVLDGTAAPDQLQGHIVLVGSSAAGLMDLRTTPLGQTMPGVLAHALALEQMVSGYALQRPAWASALEAVVLTLGTLLVGLVALAASGRRAALALAATLAAIGAGAWLAFTSGQLLMDAVNPALSVVLVFVLASGYHFWVTERQQRWLRTAFSRYVSPNRVAHLVAHPEQLHLGGQRQVCSFVFTDLEGFTPMMESRDPAQVVALLNDYLEAMLVIVFKYEGTLDRFVGDAMVVLFSAPVEQADHRQRALDCVLEMDAFATDYARRMQAQGVPWGMTRIGVHCGEVIVGNFGGKALFDYRALGDPINTAARLETVNKHLGTRVCVSQAILDGCSGVAVRDVGRLVLKGKRLPLQVYTPEATLDAAACAPPQDYALAMRLLQPGPAHDAQAAHALFEALALRRTSDPLLALHLKRLRQGASDDLIVMAEK
jgi:adenylate cyclase